MARPVEFEYDAVLANAMEQFWKEGYEASSVQKLLDVTGINRGTLYNSFGDKDTFFRLCVDRYNSIIKADIDATLGNKELKPQQAIEDYFKVALLDLPNKLRVLGDLLVNSVCESINWDKDMQKLLRNSLNNIRKAFLVRTKELDKDGQLKKGMKPELAADILMNNLQGLRVSARNGKAPKLLSELANAGVASILK